MGTVTISLERFEELLRKEAVYDIKKFDVMHSSYASSDDKALFSVDLSAKAVACDMDDDF